MSFFAMLGMFKNRAVMYVVAGLLAVFALIYWHKSGVNRAVEDERARLTLAYEHAKHEAINAAIASSDEAIRAAKIESEKQNEKIKLDAASIIARHNAGTGRLSVPARCSSTIADNTGANPTASAGEARAELSDESVKFFVGEAKRADEVVIERNELISIIEELRKVKK